MKVSAKPQYEAVSKTELSHLLKLYTALAANLARAWHQASRELFELNREWSSKGKTVPEMERLMAYDVVWQHYDLNTRAALYLCEPPSHRLSLIHI